MELWGGIECSRLRVGDRTFDQLSRSGHYDRIEDLDRIAALGIRRLRYPLLWERAATATPGSYDFSFADSRIPRLQSLGITPIAGLVHHGSGPDYTDLLDENFATGLADYAGRLVRRFPDLEWFTPVNEPLTTARFSGLYGHWHPHGNDDRCFARILINECRATVLAMRAIRAVNPDAKLVQTDDLGTIYSSPALQYQADFENERRWLGWDLLCGFVHVSHPLYGWLVASGISARELAWFEENCCPPEVIGIDHYVTSDRFLDENIERHAGRTIGGNGRDRYADVEAVRMLDRSGTSLRHVLLTAARRYRLPLAMTECHLGCTEDEQVRWLQECWTVCETLEAAGVDVKAVTAWALLGAYDWDTLMTADGPTYESGAWCLRSGNPRSTALAQCISDIISAQIESSTAASPNEQGWWRQPDRFLFGSPASRA